MTPIASLNNHLELIGVTARAGPIATDLSCCSTCLDLTLSLLLSYNSLMAKAEHPAKLMDVLSRAQARLTEGRYRDTRHATQRKQERSVTLLEVRQVIEAGWHEKRKDEFKEEWHAWNYAIQGKTIDDRSLRVAVSFDEDDYLLVITAIDLSL